MNSDYYRSTTGMVPPLLLGDKPVCEVIIALSVANYQESRPAVSAQLLVNLICYPARNNRLSHYPWRAVSFHVENDYLAVDCRVHQ